MKLVSWNEWLLKHIPYYEAERHRNRFLDNPPEVVLIVYIMDRAVRHPPGQPWESWEDLNSRIHRLGYDCASMFLERDTRQEWYWAFWNEHEALISVLKLS
jgi:hypothetical protein